MKKEIIDFAKKNSTGLIITSIAILIVIICIIVGVILNNRSKNKNKKLETYADLNNAHSTSDEKKDNRTNKQKGVNSLDDQLLNQQTQNQFNILINSQLEAEKRLEEHDKNIDLHSTELEIIKKEQKEQKEKEEREKIEKQKLYEEEKKKASERKDEKTRLFEENLAKTNEKYKKQNEKWKAFTDELNDDGVEFDKKRTETMNFILKFINENLLEGTSIKEIVNPKFPRSDDENRLTGNLIVERVDCVHTGLEGPVHHEINDDILKKILEQNLEKINPKSEFSYCSNRGLADNILNMITRKNIMQYAVNNCGYQVRIEYPLGYASIQSTTLFFHIARLYDFCETYQNVNKNPSNDLNYEKNPNDNTIVLQ